MKSLAVISLLTSLVLAQNPTNPLIPSGISGPCQTFFTQLDANASLAEYLKPFVAAISPLITTADLTSTVVNSALDAICSSPDSNADTLLGSQLGQFQAGCQSELTSNKDVILAYDVLYLLGPLKNVLCQKENSKYCVASASSPATKRALLNRRADAQEAFTPNITAFQQDNIPFLGLQPSLSKDQLCVPCTRDVMTTYTTQMNKYPYAPGTGNSVLLASEPALYGAINSKCGASFLGGAVEAAGGLATGAAPRSADGAFALAGSVIAAAAGAIALL